MDKYDISLFDFTISCNKCGDKEIEVIYLNLIDIVLSCPKCDKYEKL
jgi:uncharacterized Zn finger protein